MTSIFFACASACSNYLSHATALYICSSQIAQDFTTLIEDPDTKAQNEFTPTVVSMREEHQTLASEQVPKLQNAFSTQILAQIDDEVIKNSEIHKRIARRLELFKELGYVTLRAERTRQLRVSLFFSHCVMSLCVLLHSYYQTKVNELRVEREARAGKGKVESAGDQEKFQRNIKKLEEIQITYSDTHGKLMADLNRILEADRIKFAGPVMNNFVKQEKKMAAAYSEAMTQIKG
jgi:hypothetical protein